MSPPLGWRPPLVKTPCAGKCGAILERRGRLARAKCRKCVLKTRVGNQCALAKVQREQARRYRILLHLTGFVDAEFADLVAELRRGPLMFRTGPEDTPARRDFKREGLLRIAKEPRARRLAPSLTEHKIA